MEKPWDRGPALGEEVAAGALEAVADQPEQGLDAVVQVVAVQGLLAGQAHHLQVAQPFQAVALAVRLGLDRRVAEVGPRLDVEQEQQPVHVAQGLEAELAGQRFVEPVDAVPGDLAEIPDRLVADQLDRFAQRVLQILGDRERVLVAVVVQAVEQARALLGQQAFAVQQGGGGLQRVVLAASEHVVEVEAQQPVVGPLAALDQDHVARGEQDDPARRMRLAEDAAGDDVAPALPKQRLGRRRLAVVLGGMGLEVERVFVLASGAVVGAENQQGDGAVLAPGEQHRHLVAILEEVIVGLVPVAEGVEELGEPPALALDPRLVPSLVRKLAAELEVVAGEGSQRLVRGSGPGARAARRFGRIAPARDGVADVPGEDLGEVVVAVELVLVVDSGERGRSVGHGVRRSLSARFPPTSPTLANRARGRHRIETPWTTSLPAAVRP